LLPHPNDAYLLLARFEHDLRELSRPSVAPGSACSMTDCNITKYLTLLLQAIHETPGCSVTHTLHITQHSLYAELKSYTSTYFLSRKWSVCRLYNRFQSWHCEILTTVKMSIL
jgi:hypothetical protein